MFVNVEALSRANLSAAEMLSNKGAINEV